MLIVATLVAGYFAYLVWSGFFAFDTCLDRGGVYFFDTQECSFTAERGGDYERDRPPLWPF